MIVSGKFGQLLISRYNTDLSFRECILESYQQNRLGKEMGKYVPSTLVYLERSRKAQAPN